MPVSARRLLSNMMDDLKEERDELSLQIHLGKQKANGKSSAKSSTTSIASMNP